MIRFGKSPTGRTSPILRGSGGSRPGLAATVLVLLAAACPPAMAASGDLDTGFSTDGLVLQTFTGTGSQVANAVAVDGNGKVVVAGTKSTNTAAFARYDSAGALDTTFSGDGLATVTGACTAWSVKAIAIDASNRVVFAGACDNSFAIGRLTAAGALDTSFAGGSGVLSIVGWGLRADALAVQPDGKYVLAGVAGSSTVRFARFTSTGSVDTTFGETATATTKTGTMTVSFPGPTNACDSPSIKGLAVQQDGTGRIVGVGDGICGAGGGLYSMILIGLTSAGVLDTSFYGNGIRVDNLGYNSLQVNALSIPGGNTQVTVAGTAIDASGNKDMVLARFTSFGLTANTFGASGKVLVDFGVNSQAFAVVHQPDASILVAGTATTATNPDDFAVARLSSAGVLDTAFSTDGKATTPFGASRSDRGLAMAIKTDRLYVAGGSTLSGTESMAVAAYLLQTCGNGVVENLEACDGGVCCDASKCAFILSGTVCRSASGICDNPETCTGTASACPADTLMPTTIVCRTAAGVCDVAETCNGTAKTCPADTLASNTTSCRASAGICDKSEVCTGTTTTCPADGKVAAGTTCRASAGACDVAEACDGFKDVCAPDVFQPATLTCRSSAGICDPAESCTGTSATCPADALATTTTTCRAAAGICDKAETCGGASAACPVDSFQAATFACRASAGICDAAETCSGTSATCPADAFAASTTTCRASAGICDPAEACTGTAAACPANAFAPTSTTCRGAAGICDTAEACTGTGAACPTDAFVASTATCRSSAGICDNAERCTGSTAACPVDAFAATTVTCRASAGICDVAESCSGASAACPADGFQSPTAPCRASAGVCDVAESCTGTAAACPADGFAASTTTCRAGAGICDVAEACTGTAAACPTDAFAPGTTTCRAAAGVCDATETCSGTAATCPADAKSTAACRASTGVCDPTETCDGVSNNCPADALSSSTTTCRGAAGICDVAEACTGTSGACPSDALRPATFVCRASAGECDTGETCTGTDAACPANVAAPTTQSCSADTSLCTVDRCDGTGNCVHVAGNAGVVCRVAAGECDAAETCSGTSGTCPVNAFQTSGTPCTSDGVFCNGVEQCNGSGNCAGPGDPCTANAFCANLCNESADTCNRPAGTTCASDGLFCDGVEQCNGSGTCASPGDPCAALGVCYLCNDTTDACEDTDPDLDGSCLAADNCPAKYNPDQLNSDCPDPTFFGLGGCSNPALVPVSKKGCCDGGDVCDPCAANPNNERCDPNLSGGQSIGAAGGSFTLDGCISITIPPGALSTDTSISVSTGEDDPINPATGQPFNDPVKLKGGTTSVHKIIMLPDNQTFALPITIGLCWDDRDSDGVVDKGVCLSTATCTETGSPSCDANGDCNCGSCLGGGSLPESNLRLRRDGGIFDRNGFHAAPQDACGDIGQQNVAICGPSVAVASCADIPGTGKSTVANCCSPSANTWPFQTCYFSEYFFGPVEGALIPGRGSATTDCRVEWSVVNPFNATPYDKSGYLNFDQRCTDGDGSCDADGAADGVCTLQVSLCMNVDDSRIVDKLGVQACKPGDTAKWAILKPLPTSANPVEADAAAALRDEVVALGGTIGGTADNEVTFAVPLASTPTCTQSANVVIPAGGKLVLKAASTDSSGLVKDVDKLKLACLAPSDK